MNSRISKILTSISMFIVSIMAIVLLNSNSVSAAEEYSLDIYYPDSVLATSYNEDGSVKLNTNFVVYVHNNGYGYRLDSNNDDKLRISEITVENGSYNNSFSVGDDDFKKVITKIESADLGKLSTEYGSVNLTNGTLDKVTINISSLLGGVDNTNFYSNDVTIEIKFQVATYFFWVKNWDNVGADIINCYKGGEKQPNDTVTLNKTDDTFASSQLKVSYISVAVVNSSNEVIESPNCSSDNLICFNKNDYNDGNKIKITLQTNFKINGAVDVYSGDTKHFTFYFSSKSDQRTLSIYVSTAEKITGEIEYVLDSFKVTSVTDKYGSFIDDINNNGKSVKFAIDTVAPEVDSVGISTTSGTYYDLQEIMTKFEFSEKEFTFTIKSLKFGFYDNDSKLISSQIITCSGDSCTSLSTSTSTKESVTKSYYLSGNGIVKLVGFEATITDEYGNETSYTENDSKDICNSNNEVKLVSSITEISTNKTYYYSDEDIEFKVTLSDENVNLSDFSKKVLILSDKNGETEENISSFTKDGVNVNFSFKVGDKSSKIIKSIEFYKPKGNLQDLEMVYSQELNIKLNDYLSLGLEEQTLTNPNSIEIYNKQHTFNESKVSLSIVDSAINSLSCKHENNLSSCTYNSVKDGTDKIVISEGAVTLEKGQRNKEETLTVIVNTRAPEATITVGNSIAEYNNITYYASGDNLLIFSLSDGYYETQMCLYYKINGGEEKVSCTISKDTKIKVSLPSKDGTYTISYYTSDGTNKSVSTTYDGEFVYRGTFNLSDIKIFINDNKISSETENINSDEIYNKLKIEYSDAKKLDLLKSFNATIYAQKTVNINSTDSSGTFTIDSSELGNLSDSTMITIKLIDELENTLTFTVWANLDTIAPSFDSIVTEIEDNDTYYNVKISGYNMNELSDIYVEVDGGIVDLYDQSLLYNQSSFSSEEEKYTLVLIDKAGNEGRRVYTTKPSSVQLIPVSTSTYTSKYELYLTPFDSSIHQIESFRYFAFDYLSSVDDAKLEVAKNNVCTTGRKVNCYINADFDSSSQTITQNFDKGYSYILEIVVSGTIANQLDTNHLPRLDIAAADTSYPVGEFLDEDINPDYISSTSGKEFTFNFLASDANLTSSYYYLIVKSSISGQMNVTKFYDLYKNCYGATSSSNSCAIKGENSYKEETDEDTYLGEVIIASNATLKRRMENGVYYSLYVLISDTSDNTTLFRIREFKNITEGPTIKYLDDNQVYQKIENGSSITTTNTSKVIISKYDDIEISDVKINNETKTCNGNGCNYDLGIAKYVVRVIDVLENVSEVTIYSGTGNNPLIYVNYEYNGEYFRILDNSFAYNTNNASKVYIKVLGSNLSSVKVSMDTTKTYQIGDLLFQSITSQDNEYGINLNEIVKAHGNESYSGNITISAINESEGETIISLLVDNEKPVITLRPAGSKVINLLGTLYDLDYSEGKYTITFNYQRDITYLTLMQALSLKIDGIDFEKMISNNRLSFKVNNNAINNYDESITKGSKTIEINYFDNAGNVADTICIVVTSIDNEKPTISLTNVASVVELNTDVRLADVLVSDNHDFSESLVITSKINGETIDYQNYRFLSVGEYVITYTVTDASENENTIEQNIIVMDTIAPSLKEGTITEYTIGVGKELMIDIPTFIDSDPNLSEYFPYQISIKDINDTVMDNTSSTYPLIINENKLKLRFLESLPLGEYEIVFVVQDSQNNVSEDTFTINLIDDSDPVIEIKVNGKVVENGGSVSYAWGSIINLELSAMDSYTGDLTSKINKQITFNGNSVTSVDSSKNGDYIVEVSVRDESNNVATSTITIKINQDYTAPVINQVYVNDVLLTEKEIIKINGNSLYFVVDASDESNDLTSKIILNNKIVLNANQLLSIESNLSGVLYQVKVVVSDKSGNESSETYSMTIDNKLPEINGVENGNVYDGNIILNVYDANIELIRIYRNGSKINEYATNLDSMEISSDGVYQVQAQDTYGNISNKVFQIKTTNSFEIVDSNGSVTKYDFSKSLLIKTTVDGNSLTFTLANDSSISSKDKVYLLVNYPYTGYKYIAYSMDGATYLSRNSITIDSSIIPNMDNINLLEQVGEEYYAYAMVVKAEDASLEDNKDNSNNTLKTMMWFVLFVVGGALILYLIIKIRRRVHAA